MPAFGIVLALLGLWLILRTVRKVVPLKNGQRGGLVQLVMGEG